jgi:hypothetical protein
MLVKTLVIYLAVCWSFTPPFYAATQFDCRFGNRTHADLCPEMQPQAAIAEGDSGPGGVGTYRP